MNVVGVCMARNEAETIGSVVEHMLNNGVSIVVVEDGHSTDRTKFAALDAGAIVIDEQDRAYNQADRMSQFAADWCSPGDWYIPFDADEYWYATEGGTIREALEATHATACLAWMYQHKDWEHRSKGPKPLPKVAVRWQPGCRIQFGNHGAMGYMDGPCLWGVLDLREWQYRSFEHFLEKVAKQRELLAHTPGLDGQFGAHKRALVSMNDRELEAEWVRIQQEYEWVFDPIPSLSSPPSTPDPTS